jgi:soluble lytic murein transglycosylase-like protein
MVQPIEFCDRCRGMKVGYNRRYVLHRLVCGKWMARSSKLLVLSAVLVFFVFKSPISTGLLRNVRQAEPGNVAEASFMPSVPEPGQVASISELLARYGVDGSHRERVAKAIAASSLKYNVDPKLVASVIIVESGANPFAVSESNAVGIMQIHLPTWGPMAEEQGINLFKIEDNADLGVRILSGYIKSYGEWGGVAHYLGQTDDPESQRAAAEYVQKVQKVYGVRQVLRKRPFSKLPQIKSRFNV